MQDGVLYSNILLKLYLKSLKHGGRLQLDEDIPYTAQMIATITRQQIGTVERALQIFLKLGLVEVLDSGTFYMSNIELLIGQSSTEAERKRAARLQNKALSAPRTNGGHLSDIRPPEIEIEKEIEKGHPAHAYGRYQNVFLTDGELADLQASFPTVWGQYIEKLSEYMASTGKRYQSHAATIRRWAGEDAKKTITPLRNRELMSMDELAVMDGSKRIVQLRGVRPFLSEKYDLTAHPNYALTADYDQKNYFDIEKFLNHKLVLKENDQYEVMEIEE